MSRSRQGSPKSGSVPSTFKRGQVRSQKRKQQERDRKLFADPEKEVPLKFKKSHRWDYF
jgi:hypothetical protein